MEVSMKKINLTTLSVIIILILLTGCNQEVVTEGDNLFSEGLVAVSDLGEINYMNPEGEVVIKTDYANAFNFTEGLAAVLNEKDKVGYINKQGEIVIDYKFDKGLLLNSSLGNLYFKKDGYDVIIKDKQFGVINRKGEYILEPKYMLIRK
jgi:hypothetical protein